MRQPLRHLQGTIVRLYDLERVACVSDFLCSSEAATSLGGEARERGETLFVVQTQDDHFVGLYVDPTKVEMLERRGEAIGSDQEVFEAYCLAAEGVSHFVYLMFRVHHGESVTQLELEVQAEVDKYAAALLSDSPHALSAVSEARNSQALSGNGVGALRARSRMLRERLFTNARFLDGPDTEQGARYRRAHRAAARYTQHLEASFIDAGRVDELARSLRRFYRLGSWQKLEAIEALDPPG